MIDYKKSIHVCEINFNRVIEAGHPNPEGLNVWVWNNGEFWVVGDEYGEHERINFCPVCGEKAPKQFGLI